MSSRDIKECVPELQEKIPLIIAAYALAYGPKYLKPVCTLRSTVEQQDLYARGRTTPGNIVTNIDGITKFSNHNPTPKQPLSRAVDFGVFQNGRYLTDKASYLPLGAFAAQYNLVWVGSWTRLKDYPHIEVKES